MTDGIRIDVSQLNRLAADLSKAPVRAQLRARALVGKLGYAVEATAKQFCPVDTGFLRSSIGTEILLGPNSIRAVVGTDVEYAEFVEFGTAKMAPRAFLGPALDRVSPTFIAAVERLGGDVL